jgi:hypothetical protein
MSMPLVLIATRDIAKGATVTAVTHAFEPPSGPITPLPNPVPVASQAAPDGRDAAPTTAGTDKKPKL